MLWSRESLRVIVVSRRKKQDRFRSLVGAAELDGEQAMGGGSYSQDIAYSNRQGGTDWSGSGRTGVHDKLNPLKPREVNNETPIVMAMDVTRSRGDDTKKLYEQLPDLMKKLKDRGYVDGPGISFAAVGDAYSDRAPLQVGQFEGDNRLDEVLERFWIEEGGGGTGQESYELAAHYYSRTNCVRLAKGEGAKGFFFFVGDEGFYPEVSGTHRTSVLKEEDAEDIDSSAAFAALQEKFHTFLIYPGKTMEQRKGDIDAEIRNRVIAAGGQYDDVDVRVSLIWDNRNDVDLHVTTPSGEEIYYGRKRSACAGELDVDRNVQGETNTPVENTRWASGLAPEGTYKVKVRMYSFKEEKKKPTPFRVEIEVGGELLFHEGVVSPNLETGSASDIHLPSFEFVADTAEREAAAAATYEAYSDDVVLAQWNSVLPEGHIIKVKDPKAITDVIVGALAIANGRETVAGYTSQLKEDGAKRGRLTEVRRALKSLPTLV